MLHAETAERARLLSFAALLLLSACATSTLPQRKSILEASSSSIQIRDGGELGAWTFRLGVRKTGSSSAELLRLYRARPEGATVESLYPAMIAWCAAYEAANVRN